VITAAGAVKIDRCAFVAEGGLCLKDSSALVSKGGALEVNRCWFQGFDKAIEVFALNGSDARIRQTMIVPAPQPAPAQAQQPEWHGWGVKVQLVPGGRPQIKNPNRRLILDHCTVEGAGLLDLTSCPAPAFLQLDIKHCAVRANSILACKPRKAGESPAEQVHWLGEGNQYNIHGRSWIVLSATEGFPAFSTDVTDLNSWLLRVAVKDSNPIRHKLKYQTDPAARSNPLRPRDFAIEASPQPQAQPGADPDQVGPWNSP
jgi:hypothetical protein